MQEEEIKKLLQKSFSQAQITIKDTRGTGDHFEIKIITPDFEGKSLIERHRMVYQALGENIGTTIHAASLITKTPNE